jgi:hypothetical protein
VCAGTDAKDWWRISGQRLLRCTGCGHGSIAELPPAGGVAEQLTAPNLHDHMAVSAIYMPQTETS